MRESWALRIASYAAVVGGLAVPAAALNITLDYAHDTFFSTNPTAKAAIEAAAADLNAAITTTLAPITTDLFTGQGYATGGRNTTATFDAAFYYTNPTTGAQVEVAQPTLASDEFRVYVGGRNLTSSSLGVGGPGGVGLSLNVVGYPESLNAAVSQAASAADAALTRGNVGPTIGMLSGSISLSPTTAVYSLDFGSTLGNFWIDLDTNNNGIQDSSAQLANYWHFDHTTPVAIGKNDLYSVALHELIHTLGIGSSSTWNSLVAGTTWLGAEAIAENGTGANLIALDGDHIAPSLLSTRISDGAPQETVMDPTITVGSRKTLTMLDLAFLRDLGWETIDPIVPAGPADFNANGAVDGADLAIWTGAYGYTASGDANSDGKTAGDDYIMWQTAYGTTTAKAAGGVVPEPATGALAALVLLGLRLISRKRATAL